MKYFTPEWAGGYLTDAEFDAVVESYERRVAVLLPRLPQALRDLTATISIHDGLIRRVEVSPAQASLELHLRCGDLQVGYFDLDLMYRGVEFSRLDLMTLAAAARDRRTEVRYEEVDVEDDGLFVHRLLFWPHRAIELVAKEVHMVRTPRSDRSVLVGGDPFVELDPLAL